MAVPVVLTVAAAVACGLGCRHGGPRAWIVLTAMLAAMCAMLVPGAGGVAAGIALVLLALVLWTVASRGRGHAPADRRSRARECIDLVAMSVLIVLMPALGHTAVPAAHGAHGGGGWSASAVIVLLLLAWAGGLVVVGWRDLMPVPDAAHRPAASAAPAVAAHAVTAHVVTARWALAGSALMCASMVVMTTGHVATGA